MLSCFLIYFESHEILAGRSQSECSLRLPVAARPAISMAEWLAPQCPRADPILRWIQYTIESKRHGLPRIMASSKQGAGLAHGTGVLTVG